MKIPNPLEMNDWDIKKFFLIIISLTVLFAVFFFLNKLGINIPVIKESTAIITLIFVPGILFLRTLRLHKLGSLKTLLLAVGSSLSILMLMGFILNFAPITDPLTDTNITLALFISIIFLSITAYIMDKDYCYPSLIKLNDYNSPIIYFSILLLPLVIIGTYYLNHFSSNYLLEIYILLIPIFVLGAVFDKISHKFYPLIIFMISLSLLYHTSLISNYIWGWDIMREYSISNLINIQSTWDYKTPLTINAMLSTTILPVIFSKIINLNTVWVYKIIFPLIFALVPVGLYELVQKYTYKKIGFLSSFVFMSFYVFFLEMFQLPRQQIAELFLILTLILIVEEKTNYKMNILIVMFTFSIVVSHYATSYIIIFIFLLAILIIREGNYLINLWNKRFIPTIQKLKIPNIKKYTPNIQKLNIPNIKKYTPNIQKLNIPIIKKYTPIIKKYIPNIQKSNIPSIQKFKILEFSGTVNYRLNFNYIITFIILALVWYIYISSSANYDTLLRVFDSIIAGLNDFFVPSSTQSVYFLTRTQTILRMIETYLDLISQFLVFLGFVAVFFKFKKYKFNNTYIAVATAAFLIAITGMVVPNIASTVNTSRLFHITLIFLAPFSIIGGTFLLEKLLRFKNSSNALKILSIFLIIFFLFNSKIVYEVAYQDAQSPGLNPYYDYSLFNDKEVSGAQWLSKYQLNKIYHDVPAEGGRQTYFYADGFRLLLLVSVGIDPQPIPQDFKTMPKESYIFLGTKNIKDNQVLFSQPPFVFNYNSTKGLLTNRNKIYDNGGSQIFY